jgi:hypothetical protein
MLLLLEASNAYKEEIKRIKEKVKKKEKLTEAEKKKYEDYKKFRNKKIATGVGIGAASIAAGIATVAAADHIGNKNRERKMSNDYRRRIDDEKTKRDIHNISILDTIDQYPEIAIKHNKIKYEIIDQEADIRVFQKEIERNNKRIEELSKNKFKNRDLIRDIQYRIDTRRQEIKDAKHLISELRKKQDKYQNMY